MKNNYHASEELLEMARGIGLDMSERKLKYYVTLGILPRPVRNPPDSRKKLDGRVAYFPEITVERLNKIKELQDSGFTLPQIKKYFSSSIDPKLENFLKEQKSRDNLSPEMLARLLLSDEMRESARDFYSKASKELSEEAFQGVALEYYLKLLASLLGEDKAKKYIRELIVDATPEERERKIAPLRQWKELMDKKKSGSGIFLSSYLDSLCRELQEGTYEDGEIKAKLRELAERVHVLQNKYRDKEKLFSESFEISKFMRQIFWVYLKSLLEIENYLKDKRKDHLRRAQVLYYKADEMLNSVEALTSIVKNMINLYEEIENL